MKLRSAQPIQHLPRRPQHQRTPSSRCGKGGAQGRSKPQPSNLLRLRSRRSQPSMTTRRLRHLFKPTLLLQKSIKAYSPSVSRAAIATKPTSSSWHRSRVWFAGEAPLTPTICDLLSPARWVARSATSSRCLCAERITGTTTASATNRPGGVDRPLIPSGLRGSFGFRRGVSNESQQKSAKRLLLELCLAPDARFKSADTPVKGPDHTSS